MTEKEKAEYIRRIYALLLNLKSGMDDIRSRLIRLKEEEKDG